MDQEKRKREEEKLAAMKGELRGKHVLFVTTKNLDYLRNTQEIRWLEEAAEKVTVWGSKSSSYVKRLLKLYPKLLFSPLKKYDAAFFGFSPQLVLPFFGWRFRKKKVFEDFFISVYDTMVCDRQKFKKGSLRAGLTRWLDKKTLRRADGVITDTMAHADFFSSEFGVPREKLATLYITGDEAIYYPRPQKKPPKYKDQFIVLYFGSILPLQGVEVIGEAMSRFAGDERIRFLFIGPVDKKVSLPKQDNITYISWLSQEKLADYIAAADLCLAGHFNKEIMKAQRTIPGKAMIYETMQKPMILGDGPANREYFREDEKHTFVPMGDGEALARAIRERMQHN